MKKNTKLIKSALKELESGKVRLCAGRLKKGQSYCSVGFLTAHAAKKNPKSVDNALKKLGTFYDGGEYNVETGEYSPTVERRYDLGDLFSHDEFTNEAIEVCSRVYGLPKERFNEMVTLNDDSKKNSRVERLRAALRLSLKSKSTNLLLAIDAEANNI